jgi:MFS family permease
MSAKIAFQLMRQRRFAPLIGASALGAFNDNLFKMALIMAATAGSFTFAGMPNASLAPMAANAFTLAMFLFSAIAGQVADKYDRAGIMRRTKFFEIGLMLLAAVGFITMNGYVLLGTLFLMGIQSAFYNPAKMSSIPHYLKSEELVAGNALSSGFLLMSVLVGGALGTLLIPAENGRYWVGGVLVAMAIVGWLIIRLTPPSPSSKQAKPVRWNFIFETIRLISMVLRTPGMARPILATAWFWAIAATVITLLPSIVIDVLGQDKELTAALQVLFTVGAALGSVSCGVFSRGEDATAFSIAGALGIVVFTADLGWQLVNWQTGASVSITAFFQDPGHLRLLADFMLAAVFAGMFVVPQQALAQRRAPVATRARLLAGGNILNAAGATGAQTLLIANGYAGGSKGAAFFIIAAGSLIVAGIIIRRVVKAVPDSPS